MRSSHGLDRLDTAFDDERLVSDAGLLLPATLAQHLGLKELVDEHLDLGSAPGRADVGAKLSTLVMSALAGGDHIDDADALRAGSTGRVLGFTVKAASTLGTLLRSFRWGHVRQLERVSRELLRRAWAAGAGPGDGPLTIDLDSTICETYGLEKEGARHHGYTGVRGYHPLLAVAAGTGDVLMARLREGRADTARGAAHFLTETIGRVRRARRGRAADHPRRQRLLRPWRRGGLPIAGCPLQHHGPAARGPTHAHRGHPRGGLDLDPLSDRWWRRRGRDRVHPVRGEEGCTTRAAHRPARGADPGQPAGAVRRVRPSRLHHRPGETLELEADHRRHAEIENAIRDLEYGMGLDHLPSGRFAADGAWLAVQVMAHDLARWSARIGLGEGILTTKTLRRRFLAMPGRLTRSARRVMLHLPEQWPWAEAFRLALARLRAIPLSA